MKSQKEFKLSDNFKSLSNSDSYKSKKAFKKKYQKYQKKKLITEKIIVI